MFFFYIFSVLSNSCISSSLKLNSLSGPWTTLYSDTSEKQIKRNQLLTTIPLLTKEWRVSFEFKATSYGSGLLQVLHMTTGGKGVGRSAKYGDRTPAIWTHPTRGFLIASAVGGKPSYAKYIKGLPPTGEWIRIQVGEELEDSNMTYYVNINGTRVFSTTNSEPSDFIDVQVFSSSPWYSPVAGFLRNISIEMKNDGTNC